MPPSLSAFLEWVLHSGPPEARSGAQHLHDRLSHRQPRLRQAHYSDGRPVADGVPKAEESRLIGRLDNAYAKVVKMASGGCCAQKCLGKLDKTRLVVQALCHQAEEFQSRKTEVSRAAKEHVVEDSHGNKVVAHRVQGVFPVASVPPLCLGIARVPRRPISWSLDHTPPAVSCGPQLEPKRAQNGWRSFLVALRNHFRTRPLAATRRGRGERNTSCPQDCSARSLPFTKSTRRPVVRRTRHRCPSTPSVGRGCRLTLR